MPAPQRPAPAVLGTPRPSTTTTHHPPRLLTQEDLAGWLNVSTDTIKRMRSQGTGPAYVQLGQQVRYVPGTVVRWLEDRTVQPGGAA